MSVHTFLKDKALTSAIVISSLLMSCGGESKKEVTPDKTISVSEALEEIRSYHQVPALAGLFINNTGIVEQGAVGKRVISEPEQVSLNDKWHLGSITKSFTATLTAKLIELGYLEWNTSVVEVFPNDLMHPYFKTVTIEMLLSHQAGITQEITSSPNWISYFDNKLPIIEQRQSLAFELLNMTPDNQENRFSYSNGGYVIAGAMLEKITGQSWESLLTDYILLPLDIHDAGFGAPTDGFDFSQPYGHLTSNNNVTPVSPDTKFSDNPLAMGPAGTLHMSLLSLAKYAVAHAQGEEGESNLLSAESFTKLHKKHNSTDYAMGWFVDGNTISHGGSNTMWYAKIGIDKGKQIAAIAFTNIGGDKGNSVTDNIINTLADRNSN